MQTGPFGCARGIAISRIGLLRKTVTASILSLAVIFNVNSLALGPAVLSLPGSSSGEQIQKILDGLVNGGEIDLAPGVYEIRHPIILLHDNLTLRGSGSTTILHLADKANCPVVILGSPIGAPARATTNVHLTALLIDGNRENQQVEMWRSASDGSELSNSGVDVWKTADSSVENVTCHRCRSGGLVTSGGTRRLSVHDFTAFDNQFDGLACYLTEESHFTKLFLHDNLSAGISLDLSFNNNFIDGATLTGNDLGIFMRDSRTNVFSNLTIRQSRHHGVFMAQTGVGTKAGWRLVPGTECAGNDFEKLQISDSGGKAFLVNDYSCTNNIFDGGLFLIPHTSVRAPASAIATLITLRQLTER
jgi:parallel beta-helix repeat protein